MLSVYQLVIYGKLLSCSIISIFIRLIARLALLPVLSR